MALQAFIEAAFARLTAAINAVDAKTGGGGGGADPWTYIKLANDSVVGTTAFAAVPGMSFNAAANTTYKVRVFAAMQAAATTTGMALALDIPAGATIIGQNIGAISATTLGGTEQIADATTTAATSGVRAANTNVPFQAEFNIRTGANAGVIQLMQRSEIAGSNTTLKAVLTDMCWRVI